tara:strand:+ start:1089 stop:1664 length:576 start_codon:yes stop_codon:yes gene_type:complete
MKTITLFIIAISTSLLSFGQNPSMTISHTGLAPYDTLTVYVGDSIDFFYGGGGTHPMTEGWQSGETSTPIPFTTQTVSSSILSVTFATDTPGTYYFHCGTNPSNSANWGKITVLDSASSGITEEQMSRYSVYPNPVTDILTIDGLNHTAKIYNLIGKKVMGVNTSIIDVRSLPKGMYIIKIGGYSSTFIKN